MISSSRVLYIVLSLVIHGLLGLVVVSTDYVIVVSEERDEEIIEISIVSEELVELEEEKELEGKEEEEESEATTKLAKYAPELDLKSKVEETVAVPAPMIEEELSKKEEEEEVQETLLKEEGEIKEKEEKKEEEKKEVKTLPQPPVKGLERKVTSARSFESVLKSLVSRDHNKKVGAKEEKERGKTERKRKLASKEKSSRLREIRLTAAQVGILQRQILECWLLPGTLGSHKVKVILKITLDNNLHTKSIEIDESKTSGQGDSNLAIERARNALLHPDCNPLDLPRGIFRGGDTIVFNFSPEEMLAR